MKLIQQSLNHIACTVGSTYRMVSTVGDHVNALAVCIDVNDNITRAKYIVIKRYSGDFSVGETFLLTIDNYHTYSTFTRVLPHELRVFYDNIGDTIDDMKGRDENDIS